MGVFFLKLAVAAALLAAGALAFPAGALIAARRARRRYAGTPLARDLSGAGVARHLLDREGLSRIALDASAAPLRERYDAAAGRVSLSRETARGRSVYAAATAAFLVAQATLHADGDPDFARAHRRESAIPWGANLLPPVLLAGVVLPGARTFAMFAAPMLAAHIALLTLLCLPAARLTSRRALSLLERHALTAQTHERAALRAALAAHATRILATPLTRCFWLRRAL